MKPSLGRVVLYTRVITADGYHQQFAARITAVREREGHDPKALIAGDENAYDVLLAVDMHSFDISRAGTPTSSPTYVGSTWFTPAPVRFSDDPQNNTWRWPPPV